MGPPGLSPCAPAAPPLSSLAAGSNAKVSPLGPHPPPALRRGGGGGGGGQEHVFSLSSTREWEDFSGRPQTCVEGASVRPGPALSSCVEGSGGAWRAVRGRGAGGAGPAGT